MKLLLAGTKLRWTSAAGTFEGHVESLYKDYAANGERVWWYSLRPTKTLSGAHDRWFRKTTIAVSALPMFDPVLL